MIFNELWDGFTKGKYAIYNSEKFYINDIDGLDIDVVKKETCYEGKVDVRFKGNTAIQINNNFIAIWNMNTISKDTDNVKLASGIIHEMFHCFQYSRGEKRFPNELLGIDYPITIENISLRMLERRYLLDACKENNRDKKMELLSHFFNIRSKRENLIGKIIEYEKALESLEGTALYVEYKAHTYLHPNNERIILEEYIKGYTDINEENLNIRRSTYSQGLILGLIADVFIPDWKSKFTDSDLFLSDFIRNELQIRETDADYKPEDIAAIEKCVNNWNIQRDRVFEDFDRQSRVNSLEESFQITGFDPMNVVKRNNEVIHKNFLRIKIGDTDQVIKGPVKVVIGEHLFDVKRIEW